MSNLKDILSKINKTRDEADKVKLASELSLNAPIISTGSPKLDYRIARETGQGGIQLGRFTILVGGEGSGKTLIALKAAANAQKKTGKFVVIFDGEGTIDDSYYTRSGLNPELTYHVKSNNLEDMLDTAEEFSKADDVCMIIIDSIPIFFSTAVEAKSAEDNTIGIEAKKFNARMPIIYGRCLNRNISIIAITFYKLDPGAMGSDPRKLSRGEWQRYMSALTLDLSKGELIKDENGKIIGHTLRVRIKKSKQDSYDPKEMFEIDLYYSSGYDVFGEFVSILIDKGIIQKGGAWYTTPDGQKFQGEAKVCEYYKDNPEVLMELVKENKLPSDYEF